MRLRHAKKPLPRSFGSHRKARGIIVEADLSIGTSRLRAKLIVFRDSASLRSFWKNVLGKPDLGRRCKGAVNGLIREVQIVDKNGETESRWLEADRRYFCVIGLIPESFNAEIIPHEAVHAGFCYAKRIQRTPWDREAKRMDEESIAYPTGEIANAISQVYKDNKELLEWRTSRPESRIRLRPTRST